MSEQEARGLAGWLAIIALSLLAWALLIFIGFGIAEVLGRLWATFTQISL